MRNLVGQPVDIGAETLRVATSHYLGARTFQGGIQTYEGPGDRWSAGVSCKHQHLSAEAALACAQRTLNAMVDHDRAFDEDGPPPDLNPEGDPTRNGAFG